MEKFLDKLVIDDDYNFPIQYPVVVKGRTVMRRTDHLTLILYLKNLLPKTKCIKSHNGTSIKKVAGMFTEP